MSKHKCCVPGCDVISGSGVSLHCFPNPKKNRDLFLKWIHCIVSGLKNLDETYVFKNRRVCRRHFDPKYIYPTRLCALAVPSRLLPSDALNADIQNLPAAQLTDPSMDIDLPGPSSRVVVQSTAAILPAAQLADTSIDVVLPCSSNVKDLKTITELEMQVEDVGKTATTLTTCMLKRRRYKTMSENERAILKLSSKLQAKVRLLQKQKDSMKKQIKIVRQMKKKDEFKTLFEGLSEGAQTFFAMQLSQSSKKLKGRRFTYKEKIFCLALYKRSPKAYRFLSTFCILPKRTTLQKLLRALDLTTGVNKKNMRELRERVKKLPKRHKICALMFDEMALAPGLTYNRKNDEIVGFTDDGNNKEAVICDHALVFMVRGIIKKIKQPVCYTFCRSST